MSTQVTHPPIKRFEVTCVYSPPGATVDIVLVHGLNGHPEKTWTAKNGVFWPTDLLPASLKGAKARILVYGYNADVYAFGADRSASSDMIHQHAQTLVSGLAMERLSEDCGENAIVWVVHSLGGILVKRALELSNDLTSKSSDPSRSIYVSTYGLIFLGTPHTGADPAKWALLLQGLADAIIPKKLMDTEPQLVQTLKSNNETLQNINLHFLDIYQRFEIDMAHEAVKTDMKGLRAFVVDQASASPQLPGVRYYGIEASHSNMCKFESKSAPGYLNVSTQVRTWVLDSPPVIQSRWTAERRARQQVRENEAKELLGIYSDPPARPAQETNPHTPELSNSGIISTSMIQSVASIEPEKPSDTYFIKPPGFRPNSLFVGRETELIDMHKMLFDSKRRSEGTSAVLLQCLPGGGKSCLARQYVYTHFEDFPGGIFWVRAKSQEQLAAGFWDIARIVALKPMNNDSHTSLPTDPQEFIEVVREWFGANREWLLVLDGIQFDHSEALRRFIPDNKNSSIIYTSTERSVGGDHHFMNPQVIRLPLLSAREAQELFLLELDKKSPTQDDLKNSMELVQRMGFLPLVIHAVAQRLKATEEPLAKFARNYATGPKLRDLDTYKSIVEQLKLAQAFEALHLIHILCFFSQHIPVEMISLGLKALDVPTRAYERATGRSLNNTIKVLNRYALIDRSGQDPVRSSQSSKGSSSREFFADDVDIIKIHSVVQDFFVDSLRAEGQLPAVLSRAVVLFRSSYEKANTRICSKTSGGLVGDYRSYDIHGQRLLEHLQRSEKKVPALAKVREESLQPCLQLIKAEIERRTKESSYDIAQGRPDAYQTSIFDRTSSSSDTGPETPGLLDKTVTYTWGSESQKEGDTFESPTSLINDSAALIHVENEISRSFPPPPRVEDPGYDSDREEAAPSVMMRPLQRSDTPADPQGRRTREPRPQQPLDLHRTVKLMQRTRYHDTAGAWRAVNPPAADPRVSHELAAAFIPKTNTTTAMGTTTDPRLSLSRGRQSQAEAALSLISKNSPPPPPPRQQQPVIDRQRASLPRRALTEWLVRGGGRNGTASGNASTNYYAPAAVSDSQPTSPQDEARPWSSSSIGGGGFGASLSTRLGLRPATPAINSLERFPHHSSVDEGARPYRQPYADSGEEWGGGGGAPLYPRQMGPLPIEYTSQSPPRSPPHRRVLDFPEWHPSSSHQQSSPKPSSLPPYPSFSQTLHPSSAPSRTSPPFTFASSPLSRPQTPYPHQYQHQYPSSYREAGYSSQPMSRDPSGNGARGPRGGGGYFAGHGMRSPSLTETEPGMRTEGFEGLRRGLSGGSGGSGSLGLGIGAGSGSGSGSGGGNGGSGGRSMSKSPRMAFVQAAHIERIEEWEGEVGRVLGSGTPTPPRRPRFNPTAPIFMPRTQTQAHNQTAPPPPQLPRPATASSASSPGLKVGRGRMVGFGEFDAFVGGGGGVVERERGIGRGAVSDLCSGVGMEDDEYADGMRSLQDDGFRSGGGRRRGLSSPEREFDVRW